MLLVTGPRIDANSLNVPTGVDVRQFVPKLYEHFAACDLAVVQGVRLPLWNSWRYADLSFTFDRKALAKQEMLHEIFLVAGQDLNAFFPDDTHIVG